MRDMSRRLVPSLALSLLALGVAVSATQPSAPRQLRIIAFGAHPDDAELKAAGVASLWAAQGHKVKFVAATNGDIGHFSQAGGQLAIRRYKEREQRRAADMPSHTNGNGGAVTGELPGLDLREGKG